MGCGSSTAAAPAAVPEPVAETKPAPVTTDAAPEKPVAAALAAEPATSSPKNAAFIFVKPHANVAAVQELVKTKFAEKGITILSEGEIGGADIDTNKYIDQHYYAIASKATIMKPAELNVPEDKFKEYFGEEWATVKEEDRTFNAIDMQAKLGVDGEAFEALWDATADGKRIKFGGGFYCGCIEQEGTKYYTFNAFFMRMRGKFTAPEGSIHFFSVEFDPATLSWADFRGKVLGPTDPAKAPADSLRGILFSDWEKLGLASAPNTGDNGVHASASPFEGLAERTNWLKTPIGSDTFGAALLAAGVSEDFISKGTVDPQVAQPGAEKKGSLFDALEDMDYAECLAKVVEIAAVN